MRGLLNGVSEQFGFYYNSKKRVLRLKFLLENAC